MEARQLARAEAIRAGQVRAACAGHDPGALTELLRSDGIIDENESKVMLEAAAAMIERLEHLVRLLTGPVPARYVALSADLRDDVERRLAIRVFRLDVAEWRRDLMHPAV